MAFECRLARLSAQPSVREIAGGGGAECPQAVEGAAIVQAVPG